MKLYLYDGKINLVSHPKKIAIQLFGNWNSRTLYQL